METTTAKQPCNQTKGSTLNAECIICQETIASDEDSITHQACGIAWHMQCFQHWVNLNHTNKLQCAYCRGGIPTPLPTHAEGIYICNCLHGLQDRVDWDIFKQKPLRAIEGEKLLTTDDVSAIFAEKNDDRVARRIAKHLKAAGVDQWVFLAFPESAGARTIFLPWDYKDTSARPSCCPVWRVAREKMLEAPSPRNDETDKKKQSLMKKVGNFFKN